MRVKTTLEYRDWINALKDRMVRARIQVRAIASCTVIPVSTVS
jgi:putative component of toxin-antitoxin plasmid stabilization module